MSLTLSSGYIFSDCFIRADNPTFAQIGIGNYIFGFNLSLEVKKANNSPRLLSDLQGTLSLNNKFITFISTVGGYINVWSNVNQGISSSAQFQAVLSRENLEEIEKIRNGGDISFDINFYGIVLGGESKSEKVSTTISCKIEQTQWLKHLTTWKYSERIFLEIPLHETKAELQPAFDYFKRAQNLFFSGHWEQSVAECRKALDSLHLSLDKNANLSNLLEKRKFNSLKNRILIFILSVKEICNPATHGDENAVAIDWEKQDAEMVLYQTSICIQRVSKL